MTSSSLARAWTISGLFVWFKLVSSDTKSVFDTGRGSFEALRDDFLVLQFLVQLMVFLPFEVFSKEVTFGI